MEGRGQGDDRGVTPRQGMWKVLLLGTLVLFAARVVLSLLRTGPIVVADEMGYLGNARAIVGHIGAQMELAPFYRAGYSLLIAPLVAAGGSPTFTYHLVLVLNALLVACVFPLLYLLLTRFGAVSRQVANLGGIRRRGLSRPDRALAGGAVGERPLPARLSLATGFRRPAERRPRARADLGSGPAALAGVRLTRRFALPLIGFATLTGAVVLIRATASDPGPVNRWNISSLPFLTFELGPAVLIAAALVAVAVAGAWLLLRASSFREEDARRSGDPLLLAVTAYGAWNPVRSEQQSVYPSAWTSPQGPAEAAGGGTVSYDLDHYDTTGLYAFQWFLPNESFVLFHGSREDPPTNIVFSGDEYDRERTGGNAEEIWSAPGRDQALWRLLRNQPTASAHSLRRPAN